MRLVLRLSLTGPVFLVLFEFATNARTTARLFALFSIGVRWKTIGNANSVLETRL